MNNLSISINDFCRKYLTNSIVIINTKFVKIILKYPYIIHKLEWGFLYLLKLKTEKACFFSVHPKSIVMIIYLIK